MSNENIYERLFKLWSMVCKMIIDRARNPQKVAEVLQTMIYKMVKDKGDLQKVVKILRWPVTMVNVYEVLMRLWFLINEMIEDGILNPEKVAEILQTIINENESITMKKNYLRRLFTVTLGATDGTETYETAKKIFKAGLGADLENLGIIFSGVAPKMDIAVDELVLDGKFPNFLGNTAEKLEKCRILGAQWLKFCQDHPDKLQQGGYTTFAVLTKNDKLVTEDFSNVFVADVRVYGRDGLNAGVYHLGLDRLWRAEFPRRILCPQQ